MISTLKRLIADRRGVAALEYGVIAAAVVITASAYFGFGGSIHEKINTFYAQIASAI